MLQEAFKKVGNTYKNRICFPCSKRLYNENEVSLLMICSYQRYLNIYFLSVYLLGCTPKSVINAECQLYGKKIKKQHFPAGKDNQELPTSGLKEF